MAAAAAPPPTVAAAAATTLLSSSSAILCTSNDKERLRTLVRHYGDLLKGGRYDATSVTRFLQANGGSHFATSDGRALTADEAFPAAILLARASAMSPPEYFVDPSVFPLHAFHLDVLSRSTLFPGTIKAEATLSASSEASAVAPELLQRAYSTATHAMFALTTTLADLKRPLVEDIWRRVASVAPSPSSSSSSPSSAALSPPPPPPSHVPDAVVSSVIQMASSAASKEELFLFGFPFTKRFLVARAFMVALMLPLHSAQRFQLVGRLFPNVDRDAVKALIVDADPVVVERALVEPLVASLDSQLRGGHDEEEHTSRFATATGDLLQIIFNACFHVASGHSKRGVVPYQKFYVPLIKDFSLQQVHDDFRTHVANEAEYQEFAFSDHPCLLDLQFKAKVLEAGTVIAHHIARERAALTMHAIGADERLALEYNFLLLRIDRHNLVRSTLDELGRKNGKFGLPLRVEFLGEEGIDEGGLRKEFFQLIIKQLMDPDFGMFVPTANQRFTWFQPGIRNSVNRMEYHLIGQVIGLAVYNHIILDVQFPKLVYRKLLGCEPDLEDLREIDEAMADGLDKLLRFQESPENGTVVDVFCRVFTQEYDVFGQSIEVPLIPDGDNTLLTLDNRELYVSSLIKHLLTDSVRDNFNEFRRGFMSVVQHSIVKDLHPDELETLVIGLPSIDLQELQANAKYEGFKKSDAVITWFWDIVCNEMSLAQKKLFLKFVTGTDRVPVGGLKSLNFALGKNGDDQTMLPTAHTCFNHMMMPVYRSKDALRVKLLLAIENSQGFGLR